jgi:hypothetical protein
LEAFQRNAQTEKQKLIDDYEQKIKRLQDDLDRLKASKRGAPIPATTPEQSE